MFSYKLVSKTTTTVRYRCATGAAKNVWRAAARKPQFGHEWVNPLFWNDESKKIHSVFRFNLIPWWAASGRSSPFDPVPRALLPIKMFHSLHLCTVYTCVEARFLIFFKTYSNDWVRLRNWDFIFKQMYEICRKNDIFESNYLSFWNIYINLTTHLLFSNQSFL